MQKIGKNIGAVTSSIAVLALFSMGLVPVVANATQGEQTSISAHVDSPVTSSSYSYSVVIGGVTYEGNDVQVSLPDGQKPARSITVIQVRTDTHQDGTTSTSSSENTVQGNIVDTTVSRDEDIQVRTHRGTATYSTTIDGQSYSAKVGYKYGESSAYYLVANGKKVPFTHQPDGSWGIAESDKPVFTLNDGTSNQLAASQKINVLNNGTLENVTPISWGAPSFDEFTIINTFRISGSVEGVAWSADLKATRPVKHTGKVTDQDRSVKVAGQDVPLVKSDDGVWKATIPGVKSEPSKFLEVKAVHHQLYENGKWKPEEDKTTTYQLVAGERSDKVSYPQFGVKQHDGTQPYTGKNDGDTTETNVSVDYSYADGTKLQLKRSTGANTTLVPQNNPATSKTVWSIGEEHPVTFTLTGANKLDDSSSVIFTDGSGISKTVLTKNAIVTYDHKQVVKVNDALIVRITGSVSGELNTEGGNFAYEIPYVADRTYNDTIKSLRITETATDGTINTYDQNLNQVASEGTNQYQYTLPKLSYNHMASTYTITGVDAGADVVMTASPAQHNDDGSLTFTVLARSQHYTNSYQVTIPFAPAPVEPDANAAHLSDITINGDSIKDVNGSGFNPDRLSYTVKAAENDKVYILPIADSGVFVSAGDVTQSAGSSTYRWLVSQPGKNTTTYSVTVLRVRTWKTADEEFTPKQPIQQEGTEIAGENDTDLQSHGYVDSQGKYVAIDKDDYTIPEGGTFSYQAKSGQISLVTTTKTKGMTYRYTVNIAAPGDLSKFIQHVFTVTYITPATQEASLTGIKINGQAIPKFDPATHEYTVEVPRIDQWTIVPQYNEQSGMAVNTHKADSEATISVTSADGLVTTNYKVHVELSKDAGLKNDTTGILAQTGSSITPIFNFMVVTLMISTLTILLLHRRRAR